MANFAYLIDEIEIKEIKVPFGDLERGVVYKICSLKRTTSNYNGKEIKGMHACIETEEGMKLFTYLPKKYVEMKDELFEEINAKGLSDAKYGIAYYGTIGSTNMAKLHLPGQGLDNAFLKKCAWKRPASGSIEGSSNSKQAKDEL